ncbi:type III-B CRISPR module RAMP protein Cmr1 [Nocardiopsis dassonvillei]|uniref:type III-B CRISPR module RAMP protein Cmr1 n=1 Tax=Nocardiopsis dassonvillei TaxID=2014 RepID=UPI0020104E3E|nr:type III-B CRISPR module RAMP protein Cmr1 [Nocardiopsis dassonvillei]MCK9874113.1 type III-B CRISPR module RAMP protein Cmr1 [Nocardiopsis dassonvillei]
MAWTDFTLTVTTPVFNDHDSGDLRLSSLRGALRFWFRALIGHRVGNDAQALAKAEEHVFGSTKRPSPVRMRLAHQPESTPAGPGFLAGGDSAGIAYLAGMGLASGRRLTRRYIAPGREQTARLKVAFSGHKDVDVLFLGSLWLLCAYGGVGARTRRGFGGLRLDHEQGPLPDPWTPETVAPPTLDHYQGLQHVAPTTVQSLCAPFIHALLPENTAENGQAPGYPVLGEAYTLAGCSRRTFTTWRRAAHTTGERFQTFRTSTGDYNTVVKAERRPGKPYPVGALGLPVQYRGGDQVNAEKRQPDGRWEKARRASPLWLRFVSDEEQTTWRVFCFAFHNRFLPLDSHKIWLRSNNDDDTPVRVTDEHVRERTAAWIRSTLPSL